MKEIEGIKLSGTKYYSDNFWVSPINFMSEFVDTKSIKKKIEIHDVTLRDGEQTPPVAWKEDERLRIALELNEIGVDRIEIGMPVISESIGRVTKQLVKMNIKSKIVPMARLMKKDVELCIDTGAKNMIVEQTINPYNLQNVFNMNPEQFLERVVEMVTLSKKNGIFTTFMGWDVFRTPLDYIKRIYIDIAQKAKPDTIVFTDTYGTTNPLAIYNFFKKFTEWIPDIPLEFHTHNDFGCATASSLAAVMGGATVVHSAMNGLGERAGNAATEEIAAALRFLVGIETGVKLEGLSAASDLVAELSKVKLPPNKPIVGKQIFQIESGGPAASYQVYKKLGVETGIFPFTPEVFGNDGVEMCLGKGAGKANVDYHLDKLNLSANEEQVTQITNIIKEEGRLRKGFISEKEFKRIADKVLDLDKSPDK